MRGQQILSQSMRFPSTKQIVIACLALASGCSAPDDSHVFTLYNYYREPTPRFHVATFDQSPIDTGKRFVDRATEDNRSGCEKVARLLQEDWDVSGKKMKDPPVAKWWCEKGRYRK
jgi:hypothetical protein